MFTALVILALVYIVYQLHIRLKKVDPKYREALAEDDKKAEVAANKAIAGIKRFFKRVGDLLT